MHFFEMVVAAVAESWQLCEFGDDGSGGGGRDMAHASVVGEVIVLVMVMAAVAGIWRVC